MFSPKVFRYFRGGDTTNNAKPNNPILPQHIHGILSLQPQRQNAVYMLYFVFGRSFAKGREMWERPHLERSNAHLDREYADSMLNPVQPLLLVRCGADSLKGPSRGLPSFGNLSPLRPRLD